MNLSKENLKLAGELFCKCIESTTDVDVFSASLEYLSYVNNYSLIIYVNNSNSRTIDEEFSFGSFAGNDEFSIWLNEMMEILTDEKSKSDYANSPERIESTKQKLKEERISRIKKTLVELEA